MSRFPGHSTRRVTLPRIRDRNASKGYKTITTDGDSVTADSEEQTLSIVGGTGITVSGTNGVPDEIVITGSEGVTDHGALSGLLDDDHTQYHNNTRGDSRYYIQPDADGRFAPIAKGVSGGDGHDHSGGDGAEIDHTTLGNIGTNTHAQVDTHIANVTTNPHAVDLSDLGNPTANKTFTMANKTLAFRYVAPTPAGDFAGAFEIEATGGFTGNLVHIHQHTGTVGAVTLLGLEAEDADVVPFVVEGIGTHDALFAKTIRITALTASQIVKTDANKGLVSVATIDHGTEVTGLDGDDHPQYLLVTNIDDTPVNAEVAQPISSNWAYDHAADASAHGAYLLVADIDDTPVDSELAQPISSNWAYDHVAAADPHTGYRLESADHTHQTTGAQAGKLDHGLALDGLSDDDHSSYLLASDATDRATFATNWTDLTDAGASTLHKHDHGGMDGLSGDDHAQYPMHAGRSGGQSIRGGVDNSDDLTLSSTSGATKGSIIFGTTTAYDEVNDRLGIGTAAPATSLHINSAVPEIRISDTTGTVGDDTTIGQLVFYSADNSSSLAVEERAKIEVLSEDDGFGASHGIAFYTRNIGQYAERVRINKDGNVGIGTATAPHGAIGMSKLAIDGTNASDAGPHVQFTTASDDYPLMQLYNWSHDNCGILFDAYSTAANWVSSDAGSNFAIVKNTDNLEFRYDSGVAAGSNLTWNVAMNIDTSGDVALGRGSTSGSYRLDAYDTAATYVSRFWMDGDNAAYRGIAVWAGKDTATANSDCRWIDLGDGNGTIRSYIGYTTSSPYAAFYNSSDVTLKENIKVDNNKTTSLEKINKLKFFSYNYKEKDGKRLQSQESSFVAQQLRRHFPECIAENETGTLDVTESPLVKHLVKAVQELTARIEELEK